MHRSGAMGWFWKSKKLAPAAVPQAGNLAEVVWKAAQVDLSPDESAESSES
jgi:hypothetical protein